MKFKNLKIKKICLKVFFLLPKQPSASLFPQFFFFLFMKQGKVGEGGPRYYYNNNYNN